MVTKIGLDIGYANISLSDITGEVYREPSVALVYKEPRSDGRRIISVGEAALRGEGAPDGESGLLVRPFKNGLLFDSQITREIISSAIRTVGTEDKIRCVVGLPSAFLPKQEKEIFDMLHKAGVETVLGVSRAVAALVGAGYSPSMSVISVNVGALTTEIAVMHEGRVIIGDSKAIGGEDFDKAVKKYILEQGDVNVSLMVARAIKEKLGAVWKGKPNDSIDIEGTLSLTGNILKMNITTEDIVGVFEAPLQSLMMAIVDVVKQIPPAIVEDVFKNGIVLTGGGAELFGLDMLMSKVLGIPAVKASDPMDCVAKGLSRINAFLPAQQKSNNKNITSQVASYYEKSKK